MRSSALLVLILQTFPALALETDNYLSWDEELRDSSDHINRYLSLSIRNALHKISSHDRRSCEEMTTHIEKDFESHLVHDNPVELWLFETLSAIEMFPMDLQYVEESIYRSPTDFIFRGSGLLLLFRFRDVISGRIN